ncbi:hypothetical protein K8I28_06925 [bacterium]|nr:hypothetical protein [bacterium]
MTRGAKTFSLILCLLLAVSLTKAAELSAKVTYVAGKSVYIDAGINSGISVDDEVVIRENEAIIARLKVLFVSSSNASLEILEGNVKVGDTVIIHIEEEAEQIPETYTTETILEKDQVDRDTQRDKPANPMEKANRLDGKIALQYRYQDDLSETNYDVTEPSLLVRTEVENLLGTHHTLNIRLRMRRTSRDYGETEGIVDEWSNRIYEISLSRDADGVPYHYEFGRIRSNRLAGMGAVDGILAEMVAPADISVGVFAGSQPEWKTSNVNFEETKAGLFASKEAGSWESHRLEGTVAVAGKYIGGEINREFVYEQVQYSLGRAISLYQSAEWSINRGWREEVSSSMFELSNILLNARWKPVDWLRVEAGYDNRTLFRTWDTRETPDSLFDDAIRTGYRAGMTLELPMRTRLYARGGLRTREGDSQNTTTWSTGITQSDLLYTGIRARVQASFYENKFSTGYQPSIALSRNITATLWLTTEAGLSSHDYSAVDETATYNWARVGMNLSLSRSLYASGYYEGYRGNGADTNRIMVEMGYRL